MGDDEVRADIVINAAGAWGDVVAAMADVAPLGLRPLRRTAFMVEGPEGCSKWPLVGGVSWDWYFKPDHGVHAVWGGYVNLRATLERFTQTQLQLSYGEEWINRWGKHVRYLEAGNAIRGRYIPAPFHYLQLLFNPLIWANIAPWDFLSLPGLLLSIMLTVGIDPIKEERPLDGLGMNLLFRGWTPNLRATFRGLAVNLLAAPEDEIDLSALIAALRFYTMLRRDAWETRYFPADSHTSLIRPLLDTIEASGGKLLGSMTAHHLQQTADGWCIIAEAGTGDRRTFYAKHVIIATNAYADAHSGMASIDRGAA